MLDTITTGTPDTQRNEAIAALNDAARASMGIGCRLILDKAIYALPPADLAGVMQRIATWREWDSTWTDDDGQRSNGRFVLDNGMDIIWEFYYDDKVTRVAPSSDPADPAVTLRTVLVMVLDQGDTDDAPHAQPSVVIEPNFGESRR